MANLKIKKGDNVIVLAGKDKGMKGEVLQTVPTTSKVIVAGINMVKKHTKPNAQNPQGGISEFEAPIHVSNVAVVDPSTNKPVRIGYKFEGDKKIRIAKSTGKAI